MKLRGCVRVSLSIIVLAFCGGQALAAACPTITVNPLSAPVGRVGDAYSLIGTVTGGALPYLSIVATPNNPPHPGLLALTSNLATGQFAFSGTPTAPPFHSFVNESLTATDANGCTGFVRWAFIVNEAACSATITISPSSIPNGVLNQNYSLVTLITSGGTGPYQISAVGLPNGLSVDLNTGVLSGQPTQTGLFEISVYSQDTGVLPTICAGGTSYSLTIDAVSSVQAVQVPVPILGHPGLLLLALAISGIAFQFIRRA